MKIEVLGSFETLTHYILQNSNFHAQRCETRGSAR
jgi:hypothetical protein